DEGGSDIELELDGAACTLSCVFCHMARSPQIRSIGTITGQSLLAGNGLQPRAHSVHLMMVRRIQAPENVAGKAKIIMWKVLRRDTTDRRSERYRAWIDSSYLQSSLSSQVMRSPSDFAVNSQKIDSATPQTASVISIAVGTCANCATAIARSTACEPIQAPLRPMNSGSAY